MPKPPAAPLHDVNNVPAEETCPRCGGRFDPTKDEILTCAQCGGEGSTACCLPGGRGTACVGCEGDQ